MALLYKYYGFEAGLAALWYQTLGFRNPNTLNDPMEFKIWLQQHGVEDPSWFSMLNDSVGVLSLTRNAENPLMWSHYADEHRGFSIGHDENESLFNIVQVDTVISASKGDVLYDKTDPIENADKMGLKAFQWVQLGMGGSLCLDSKEALRGIFFAKHKFWKYEEEVRVVKLLCSYSGNVTQWNEKTGNNWSPISKPISPKIRMHTVKGLFTTECRSKSIKSIIQGMRNPLLKKPQLSEEFSEISKLCESPELMVSTIKWDQNGELIAEEIERPTKWGIPEETLSRTLTSSETIAILAHKNDPRLGKENITLTQPIGLKPIAYFKSELN